MVELFRDLPSGPFQIIYADPPWYYSHRIYDGNNRLRWDTSRHYNTIKYPDLCSLQVADIADASESLLFLWATGAVA